MDDQIVFWQKTGDKRQYFLSCYRLMTGNMLQAIKKRDFHDADWVERLLVRFSDYYFEALDHFEKSEPTPPVWRTVHENCCTREMHTLQYMLMGINAHINFDLVLTIYD